MWWAGKSVILHFQHQLVSHHRRRSPQDKKPQLSDNSGHEADEMPGASGTDGHCAPEQPGRAVVCHGLVRSDSLLSLRPENMYFWMKKNSVKKLQNNETGRLVVGFWHQKIELIFPVFRANPSCLGTLENFRSQFTEPIEQGQRHSATKRALATGREAVRSLARRLSRWFLRRTKALISGQLPRKDDRVSANPAFTTGCRPCLVSCALFLGPAKLRVIQKAYSDDSPLADLIGYEKEIQMVLQFSCLKSPLHGHLCSSWKTKVVFFFFFF